MYFFIYSRETCCSKTLSSAVVDVVRQSSLENLLCVLGGVEYFTFTLARLPMYTSTNVDLITRTPMFADNTVPLPTTTFYCIVRDIYLLMIFLNKL